MFMRVKRHFRQKSSSKRQWDISRHPYLPHGSNPIKGYGCLCLPWPRGSKSSTCNEMYILTHPFRQVRSKYSFLQARWDWRLVAWEFREIELNCAEVKEPWLNCTSVMGDRAQLHKRDNVRDVLSYTTPSMQEAYSTALLWEIELEYARAMEAKAWPCWQDES